MADHSTMSFLEGTTTAGPCGEDTPQMWYDMGLAVDPNNPDAFSSTRSTSGSRPTAATR